MRATCQAMIADDSQIRCGEPADVQTVTGLWLCVRHYDEQTA
jgi:hypothetical protein